MAIASAQCAACSNAEPSTSQRSFVRGASALAVRVAPPPHPGIPVEQSIKDGPGYDDGLMLIDGPTFVATEGWNWMPAMRDRDTSLWQGVRLTYIGEVTVGDPQVITRLPLPGTSSAQVEINVPVRNDAKVAQKVIVEASFEGVHLRLPATIAPGDSALHFTPSAFQQLPLEHPRLWRLNGYGAPNLYHPKLVAAGIDWTVSDQRTATFGVREVTYELTLFDRTRRFAASKRLARRRSASNTTPWTCITKTCERLPRVGHRLSARRRRALPQSCP